MVRPRGKALVVDKRDIDALVKLAKDESRLALAEFLNANKSLLQSAKTDPFNKLINLKKDGEIIQEACLLLGITPKELTPLQIALLRTIKYENSLSAKERNESAAMREHALEVEIEVLEEMQGSRMPDAKNSDIEDLKERAILKSADLDLLAMISNPDNNGDILRLMENYRIYLASKKASLEGFNENFYSKLKEMFHHFKSRFDDNNLTDKKQLPFEVLYKQVKYNHLFHENLFIDAHRELRLNENQKKEMVEKKLGAADFKAEEWGYVKPRVALNKMMKVEEKQPYLNALAKIGAFTKKSFNQLTDQEKILLDASFAEYSYNTLMARLAFKNNKEDSPKTQVPKIKEAVRGVLFLILDSHRAEIIHSQRLLSLDYVFPDFEGSASEFNLISSLGAHTLSKDDLKYEFALWNIPDKNVTRLYVENQYVWMYQIISQKAELLRIDLSSWQAITGMNPLPNDKFLEVINDQELFIAINNHKEDFEALFKETNDNSEIVKYLQNYEANKTKPGIRKLTKEQCENLVILINLYKVKEVDEKNNAIKNALDGLCIDQRAGRVRLNDLIRDAKTKVDELRVNPKLAKTSTKRLRKIYEDLGINLLSSNREKIKPLMEYFGVAASDHAKLTQIVNENKYFANQNKINNMVDELTKIEASRRVLSKITNQMALAQAKRQLKEEIIRKLADCDSIEDLRDMYGHDRNMPEQYAQLKLYQAYSIVADPKNNKTIDLIADHEEEIVEYYKTANDANMQSFIASNGAENPFAKKVDKTHLSPEMKLDDKKDSEARPKEKLKIEDLKFVDDYFSEKAVVNNPRSSPALKIDVPINEAEDIKIEDEDSEVKMTVSPLMSAPGNDPKTMEQKVHLPIAAEKILLTLEDEAYQNAYEFAERTKAFFDNTVITSGNLSNFQKYVSEEYKPFFELYTQQLKNFTSAFNAIPVNIKGAKVSDLNHMLEYISSIMGSDEFKKNLINNIFCAGFEKFSLKYLLNPRLQAEWQIQYPKAGTVHANLIPVIQYLARYDLMLSTLNKNINNYFEKNPDKSTAEAMELDKQQQILLGHLNYLKSVAKNFNTNYIDIVPIYNILVVKAEAIRKSRSKSAENAPLLQFIEDHTKKIESAISNNEIIDGRAIITELLANDKLAPTRFFKTKTTTDLLLEILQNIPEDKKDSLHAVPVDKGSTSLISQLFSKKESPKAQFDTQKVTDIVTKVKEEIAQTQSATVTINHSRPIDKKSHEKRFNILSQDVHIESNDEKKVHDDKLNAGQFSRYTVEAPEVVKSSFIKIVSDDGKKLNIAAGRVKLLSKNPKEKVKKTQVLADGSEIPADGYLIDAEKIIRTFFESQDKNKTFYIRKPNNNTVIDPLRVQAMLIVAKALGFKEGKHYVNQSGVALGYKPDSKAVEHAVNMLKIGQKVSKNLLDSLAAQLKPMKNIGIAEDVIKKIKSNQTPTLKELDDVQNAIEDKKPKIK